MRSIQQSLTCLFLTLAFPSMAETIKVDGQEYTVDIPAQTQVEVLNREMKSPRLMDFSKAGDLLIGSGSGRVYRLYPPYTKAETLVEFQGYPHSVAFRQTSQGEELWLAETSGLYRTAYKSRKAYKKADFERVTALPGGGGHSSRTVKIGPDNKVYVSLGISGNCSDEYLGTTYPAEKRRGGIFLWDESSKTLQPYASGLRNPVGFDWQPKSQTLYTSNNGPDHWGFDKPAEIFTAVSAGGFHGMPWFQHIEGQITRDSCISNSAPRSERDIPAPAAFFPARSAPLDVSFASSKDLGGRWAGQAFVALHGSWATPGTGDASSDKAARRKPKIVRVEFEGSRPSGKVLDVFTGFQLPDGSRWARPAGLAFGPDGALYFTSDDEKSGLYRLKSLR